MPIPELNVNESDNLHENQNDNDNPAANHNLNVDDSVLLENTDSNKSFDNYGYHYLTMKSIKSSDGKKKKRVSFAPKDGDADNLRKRNKHKSNHFRSSESLRLNVDNKLFVHHSHHPTSPISPMSPYFSPVDTLKDHTNKQLPALLSPSLSQSHKQRQRRHSETIITEIKQINDKKNNTSPNLKSIYKLFKNDIESDTKLNDEIIDKLKVELLQNNDNNMIQRRHSISSITNYINHNVMKYDKDSYSHLQNINFNKHKHKYKHKHKFLITIMIQISAIYHHNMYIKQF